MAGNLELAEFEGWLSKKLSDLDIDADVYGTYITGILDEEDDSESKKEALEGILGSLLEDPEDLCQQVLAKWRPHQFRNGNDQEKKASTIEDIIAAHSAKVATEKPNIVEKPSGEVADSAMKRALLAKYSEVCEEVDESEDASHKTQPKAAAPVTSGLFQNVNTKVVANAEKQQRAKEKEDHQKKKDKDKGDREKQKQKKEERKEKEKKRTQKKERSTR